jgi:hypothetical protein
MFGVAVVVRASAARQEAQVVDQRESVIERSNQQFMPTLTPHRIAARSHA